MLVVSGPTSQVRNQLIPLRNDFSPSGSSIAAISITDEVAEKLLSANDKDLKTLQSKFDSGDPGLGFKLKPTVSLAGSIGVNKITGTGRNVLGRLQAGDVPSQEVVIVGAHIDHLGAGKSGGSLAKEEQQNAIHFGADDNASGVAAMLEVAEYLSAQKKAGKLDLKRDVIFAGWSGEELGLHGSKHFAKTFLKDAKSDTNADADLSQSKLRPSKIRRPKIVRTTLIWHSTPPVRCRLMASRLKCRNLTNQSSSLARASLISPLRLSATKIVK